MTNGNYIQDTRKFWEERRKARKNLDRKRADASYSEKVTIAEKLRSDMVFLKSGRIINSKSGCKRAKA